MKEIDATTPTLEDQDNKTNNFNDIELETEEKVEEEATNAIKTNKKIKPVKILRRIRTITKKPRKEYRSDNIKKGLVTILKLLHKLKLKFNPDKRILLEKILNSVFKPYENSKSLKKLLNKPLFTVFLNHIRSGKKYDNNSNLIAFTTNLIDNEVFPSYKRLKSFFSQTIVDIINEFANMIKNFGDSELPEKSSEKKYIKNPINKEDFKKLNRITINEEILERDILEKKREDDEKEKARKNKKKFTKKGYKYSELIRENELDKLIKELKEKKSSFYFYLFNLEKKINQNKSKTEKFIFPEKKDLIAYLDKLNNVTLQNPIFNAPENDTSGSNGSTTNTSNSKNEEIEDNMKHSNSDDKLDIYGIGNTETDLYIDSESDESYDSLNNSILFNNTNNLNNINITQKSNSNDNKNKSRKPLVENQLLKRKTLRDSKKGEVFIIEKYPKEICKDSSPTFKQIPTSNQSNISSDLASSYPSREISQNIPLTEGSGAFDPNNNNIISLITTKPFLKYSSSSEIEEEIIYQEFIPNNNPFNNYYDNENIKFDNFPDSINNPLESDEFCIF